MIGRLIDFGLKSRVLVVVLAATVTVIGVVRVAGTEAETLPEFLPPIVEVQTEALGLSASEVEQLITVPLEADLLNGVAWLESIRSESMPGLSSIVMEFEPGTDVLRARQVVQERLTQAAGLPNVSRAPTMVQPLSSESRVMMIGLSSDDVSLVDMSVLARWTVRPFLMGVDGVANVSVWGQRERQLQVLVDQDALVAADLELLDIVKTTGNALWVSPLSYLEASSPGTGGFIDGPNQRIGVQHVLSIETPEDLAAIAIEDGDGLTLGDVTTVVEDHQPLIGDAVIDNGPGLLLVVEKFPWSNTVDTTRAIEGALDELAPGLTGIEVDTSLFRPADYIDRSVDNLRTRALASLLAVVLVVFALIGGWRTALVALLSLIVSVVTTALVLSLLGVEMNIMVIGGIAGAFGLLVDDSVGVTATVRQRIATTDAAADDTIAQSVSHGRTPSLYAAAALVIATVPVVLMQGPAGEFLPTIGLTVIAALVVAAVVSVLVTPALCALLLSSRTTSESSWLITQASNAFDRARRGIGSRATAVGVGAAVALLVIGAALVPTLDRKFVPEFEQTDVVIRLDGVSGTSLESTRRIATAAATEIGELPGVHGVGAHVGRAVLSDDAVNVNSSELWVNIDPDGDVADTLDSIRAIISGFPGHGTPEAATYTNARVADVLAGPQNDLVVRVYGEDPVVLDELADEMTALVASLEGTRGVRAIHPLLEPSIQIEVDLERSSEFGVKPGDVRRTAATLLSGIEVGSFFEQQKVFEVVVWSASDDLTSISSVENLLIDTPSGKSVPLSSVADVRIAPAQNVIEREAVSRYVDVVADISGRNVDAVEDDVTEAVAARGLPFEYHVGILDDSGDAADNKGEVLIAAVAVGIAILLLLQAAFDSWRLAAVLLVATPLGLAGGVVALVLSGGTYSIGSAIGLFIVAGLTLRSSLTLVDHYDELQLVDGVPFGPELAERGVRDRFGPVIISLATVAAATIPIVVLGGGAGLEVVRPLAIVVLGGVVSAAVVALVVVPALYLLVGRPATTRESLAA